MRLIPESELLVSGRGEPKYDSRHGLRLALESGVILRLDAHLQETRRLVYPDAQRLGDHSLSADASAFAVSCESSVRLVSSSDARTVWEFSHGRWGGYVAGACHVQDSVVWATVPSDDMRETDSLVVLDLATGGLLARAELGVMQVASHILEDPNDTYAVIVSVFMGQDGQRSFRARYDQRARLIHMGRLLDRLAPVDISPTGVTALCRSHNGSAIVEIDLRDGEVISTLDRSAVSPDAPLEQPCYLDGTRAVVDNEIEVFLLGAGPLALIGHASYPLELDAPTLVCGLEGDRFVTYEVPAGRMIVWRITQ